MRTNRIDAEFSNIATTINAINNNLQDIQRSDDKLKDGIVEMHSLSDDIKMALPSTPEAVELINQAVTDAQDARDAAQTSETNASNSADAAADAAASIIVATKKFNTYAEQMAYVGAYVDGQKADVLGYYAIGDSGFIQMYWSASSTAVHNGGTVRKPTAVSGAGRWLAVNSNDINVKQFGANGNAIVDDTSFIQAAIDFAASNGLVVNVPKGNYAIFTTITLKQGVSLIGEKTNPYNAAAYYPSIITHLPISANTDLFALETPATPTSYVSCGGVENLFIVGSANTRYAFNLTNPLGAGFKNIGTANAFSSVIALKGQLNCYFSDFRIINTTATQMSAAILMRSYNGESYGTTCTFERFYISGTLTASAGGIS